MQDLKKMTMIGTPISPAALLPQLAGYSFCVSYAYKDRMANQVEQIIDLVGDDQMLMLDNGAFSAWKSGYELDIDGFEAWAQDILDRCPQAIAVIPDVIDGDHEQNAQLIRETMLPTDRSMPVWHLHEPLEALGHMVEGGFYFIAVGSSGQYATPGTPEWHGRIQEMFAYLDELCTPDNGYRRPHMHLMRAQALAHEYPFDSSDSTNVAVNHHRYKGQDQHMRRFAGRVSGKIEASCTMQQRVEAPAEIEPIDLASIMLEIAQEAAHAAQGTQAVPEYHLAASVPYRAAEGLSTTLDIRSLI